MRNEKYKFILSIIKSKAKAASEERYTGLGTFRIGQDRGKKQTY